MQTYHFSGLTEIRGLAAFTVLLSHIDQYHSLYDIKEIGIYKTNLAEHAVTIFFVLSGFLITFLLLEEKKSLQKINIKNFYMRRVLRIWPVYYLSVILSLFLILIGALNAPNNFTSSILLYFFMAPNLAYVLAMAMGTIVPLWSVGVEEQFYLIWPWIVNLKHNLLKILISIVLIYCLSKIIVYNYHPTGGLYALIKYTRIDCMAIGGIFAYIIYYDTSIYKKLLFSPVTLALSLIILFAPFTKVFGIAANFEIEIFAIGCGTFISNIASNKNSFIKLSTPILSKLGKISYGVYVYHMFVIILIGPFLKGVNIFLVYTIIISTTLFLSSLSYRYFESKFLKLKKNYTTVKSEL